MSDEVDKTLCVVVGIVAICAMEIYALSQGVNGTMLSAAIGSIAAIVGYALGFKIAELKGKTGTKEP